MDSEPNKHGSGSVDLGKLDFNYTIYRKDVEKEVRRLVVEEVLDKHFYGVRDERRPDTEYYS